MEKISILFIIDAFLNLAGSERNLFEVVTRLNKDKFTPIVFALQGGSIIDDLNKRDIQAKNLNLKRIYGIKAFFAGVKLIKFIKENHIKIVVTYHESSDFWGGIIAKICKVPVIISSRRDMGYKLKKRHLYIYMLLNNIFDRVITVSDAVKEVVFEKEGSFWYKLKTIYNGVELEKFTRLFDSGKLKASLGIQSNRPVIGILAALRTIKGHRYFLEAASLVLQKFPEVYFLIVGWYDAEGDYYKELRSLIRKLNIEQNVIFTGGRSDIPEMLSIMDISVFSSINEGFSNAILESMAAGKPVVATNTGGTPEAVVDGQTGILVSPCNAEELADAMLKLLQDKKLAAEMGKASRKRAEEFFSLDSMIKEIENLYADLLEEKIYREKIALKINTETIIKQFLRILKLSFSMFLYYTRLFILFKKTIPGNKGIKILAYHRISNDNFDPLDMNIKVENFERQMRFIKAYYKLISLEQAVELLQTNHNIADDMIVVTFDDGYRDNYFNAFPILKKYKVPANIFLSAEAIEKKQILWFDAIIAAFKQTDKDCIELNKFGIKRYEFNSFKERMDIAREIALGIKSLSIKDRNRTVDLVLKQLNVTYQDIESNCPMLDWEDVKEMENNFIDFGSHGLSHSILTKLTEEEVEVEIRESKRIIQERADTEVKFFTYPNGGIGDFNEQIISLLKKNNFIAACTLIRGSNNGSSNLYSLKRFCVNSGMESNVLGRFSKSIFALEISGLFRLFKYSSYGG